MTFIVSLYNYECIIPEESSLIGKWEILLNCCMTTLLLSFPKQPSGEMGMGVERVGAGEKNELCLSKKQILGDSL